MGRSSPITSRRSNQPGRPASLHRRTWSATKRRSNRPTRCPRKRSGQPGRDWRAGATEPSREPVEPQARRPTANTRCSRMTVCGSFPKRCTEPAATSKRCANTIEPQTVVRLHRVSAHSSRGCGFNRLAARLRAASPPVSAGRNRWLSLGRCVRWFDRLFLLARFAGKTAGRLGRHSGWRGGSSAHVPRRPTGARLLLLGGQFFGRRSSAWTEHSVHSSLLRVECFLFCSNAVTDFRGSACCTGSSSRFRLWRMVACRHSVRGGSRPNTLWTIRVSRPPGLPDDSGRRRVVAPVKKKCTTFNRHEIASRRPRPRPTAVDYAGGRDSA